MSEDNKDKLAKVDPNTGAIQPSTLTELNTLAGKAAASGFFGAQDANQALLLMMTGRDIGFSYAQSLRAFHVIKGKPALSAAAMVAVCLNSGKCEFFRCVNGDKDSVTFETKRVGNPVRTLTFTMEEAKAAGLTTDMYRKFPRQMLSARCQSSLAREVYPDLLMGIYDPDELENTGNNAPSEAVKSKPAETPKKAAEHVVIPDAEVLDEVVNNPADDALAKEFLELAKIATDQLGLLTILKTAKAKVGHRADLLAEFRKFYAVRSAEIKAWDELQAQESVSLPESDVNGVA